MAVERVANAGEGARLTQADELKQWHETLDGVERVVTLCDMRL